MSERTGAWYADPTHRHAKRYFDGKEWTEHVADEDGQQASDPLPTGRDNNGNGYSDATDRRARSTTTAPAPAPASPTTAVAGPTRAVEPDEGVDVEEDSDRYDVHDDIRPPTEVVEVEKVPERRPLFGFGLGVIITLLGVGALLVSFYVLDWAEVRGPGGELELKLVDLNLEGSRFEQLTDWYDDGGYIAGLVVVSLCVLVAMIRRVSLRLLFAVAALAMLGWHLLTSLDLREVLRAVGGEQDLGAWVGIGGYGLAALGVLWGPGRRRRTSKTTGARTTDSG